MSCEHMRENPDLTWDSRYVCQCGACHSEVDSQIRHLPSHSEIRNVCSKCGRSWLAQIVRSW